MKGYQPIILVMIYTIIFSTNIISGQNFVTESKEVILEHFNSQRIEYIVDMTNDGFEVLHFKDGRITVEYYLKDGFCFVYRMRFPEEGLVESIDVLNSTFTKIKEGMWREYDGERYFIWSLDKTGNGYRISVFTEASLKGH